MDKEDFQSFVAQVEWIFAKSIPNWPHFYIVEKDLPEQAAFRAAKTFVKDSGYIGKFFDLNVFYFDADGWTYWASPLVNPPESQYMLNKCKTEYSYESCVRSGALPPEGFRGAELSLAPILEDSDFRSLMRESEDVLKDAGVLEKQRSILSRHAKIFHALAHVMNAEYIQSQCSAAQINLLKAIIADQKENQSFSAEL